MTTMIRITGTKNLDVIRYEAEQAIDDGANLVRTRFATVGKHQIYADKRAEADRFLASPQAKSNNPTLTDFPYLAAEVGITAPTAKALAELWIAMDRQWKLVAAAIENATFVAKAQIKTSRNPAQIKTVIDQAWAVLDTYGEKPPTRPSDSKKDKKVKD